MEGEIKIPRVFRQEKQILKVEKRISKGEKDKKREAGRRDMRE